eukprot:9489662-Pyramimonas_sp.AAC.1
MREALVDLIVELDLVATNTFQERLPTHFTRAHKSPQVLDYIFAPAWWGEARVQWQDVRDTGNETSDHAAVLLELPVSIRPAPRAETWRPMRPKWGPETEPGRRLFSAQNYDRLVTERGEGDYVPP